MRNTWGIMHRHAEPRPGTLLGASIGRVVVGAIVIQLLMAGQAAAQTTTLRCETSELITTTNNNTGQATERNQAHVYIISIDGSNRSGLISEEGGVQDRPIRVDVSTTMYRFCRDGECSAWESTVDISRSSGAFSRMENFQSDSRDVTRVERGICARYEGPAL